MLDALVPALAWAEGAIWGLVLVFARIAAITALLPGFGEQALSIRVRILAALGFTVLVWPLVGDGAAAPRDPAALGGLVVLEAAVGAVFGLAFRLLVMALQFAGSVAAQSTSLAQLLGPNQAPDPMPAMGNLLMLAGITLALVAGLHVKAVLAMAGSFQVVPLGAGIGGLDLAAWGTASVARAFGLGVVLAAPFVIASFAYNLALGAINRAMPQLMVAFIGAPAITGAGILILLLAAPLILTVWTGTLDRVLAEPLGWPE